MHVVELYVQTLNKTDEVMYLDLATIHRLVKKTINALN